MTSMSTISWPGRPIPEKWEGPTLADCKVYRPVEVQGKFVWDWVRMFERDVVHLAKQLPGAEERDGILIIPLGSIS